MNKAVLLGKFRRIGHLQIDLAGLEPRNRDAERTHRGLRGKGRGYDGAIIRIFRLEAWHEILFRRSPVWCLLAPWIASHFDTVAYRKIDELAIRCRINIR